ncbi:hypothetical protein Q7C36_013273 [Tachysurus vachellii]|uniref:Uncharacterized protein n=1 Tax=Tachysurus vachellii TaxID=175792 RepID=A0AA88MHP1_TACVA|nr:hypothetical protein Q7C36_013273 [Tachysurus vachellii]
MGSGAREPWAQGQGSKGTMGSGAREQGNHGLRGKGAREPWAQGQGSKGTMGSGAKEQGIHGLRGKGTMGSELEVLNFQCEVNIVQMGPLVPLLDTLVASQYPF